MSRSATVSCGNEVGNSSLRVRSQQHQTNILERLNTLAYESGSRLRRPQQRHPSHPAISPPSSSPKQPARASSAPSLASHHRWSMPVAFKRHWTLGRSWRGLCDKVQCSQYFIGFLSVKSGCPSHCSVGRRVELRTDATKGKVSTQRQYHHSLRRDVWSNQDKLAT